METNSATKKVEKLILEQVGEEPVGRKVIVDYIHSQLAESVSDGVIAGAFKSLAARQEIEIVGRGYYKKGAENNGHVALDKIISLCKKFKVDLNKASTLNMLEVSGRLETYAEFFKVLEQVDGTIDSFIGDLQKILEAMPVMNGYEATEQIRALEDPALAKIRILAMTANAFDEDRKKALKCGMDGFMSKPIVMEELIRELQNNMK